MTNPQDIEAREARMTSSEAFEAHMESLMGVVSTDSRTYHLCKSMWLTACAWQQRDIVQALEKAKADAAPGFQVAAFGTLPRPGCLSVPLEGEMLQQLPKHFHSHSTFEPCGFHQRHPFRDYARCTCSGSMTSCTKLECAPPVTIEPRCEVEGCTCHEVEA